MEFVGWALKRISDLKKQVHHLQDHLTLEKRKSQRLSTALGLDIGHDGDEAFRPEEMGDEEFVDYLFAER